MARTVTDAAMLLNVLAGSDPADPASKDADAHKSDYTKGLETGALKGNAPRCCPFLSAVITTRPSRCSTRRYSRCSRRRGAELVEIPAEAFEDLGKEQLQIIAYEFKDDLAAYLKDAPAAVKVRTVDDLVEFQKNDPRESMHTQAYTGESAATARRQAPEYAEACWNTAVRKAGDEGYRQGVDPIYRHRAGDADPRPGGRDSAARRPVASRRPRPHPKARRRLRAAA